MNEYAKAFAASRDAVCEVVSSGPAPEWERTSPLTPLWKVREVLAHLVGVSRDVSARNLPRGDINEWAQRQVALGAGLSLDELVRRWRDFAIEDEIDESFQFLLFDQVTHEYDIRYALHEPGPESCDRVRVAAASVIEPFRPSTTLSFRLRLDGVVYYVGSGDETIDLETSHFEFLRLRAGRRSWQEITELPWRGDLNGVRSYLFDNDVFEPASFRVNETTS